MTKSKVEAEVLNGMVEMYRRGKSIASAAASFGVNRETARKHIRALGLGMRDGSKYKTADLKTEARRRARAVEVVAKAAARDAIRAEMATLLRRGLNLKEIGWQLGVTGETVRKYLKDIRTAPTRGSIAERNKRIVIDFRSGQSVQFLAAGCRVTDDAIRVVLRAAGITEDELKASRRRSRKALKGQYIEAVHGMSYDEWIAVPKEVRRAFKTQRQHASYRGIGWKLNFRQWLDIWQASGKLNQRGGESNEYVMSRYGDKGDYEIGNVFINTKSMNSAEAALSPRVPSKYRGVQHVHPGRARGWYAYHARKGIGFYASPEEAAAARDAYLAAIGISLTQRNRSVRYAEA